MDNKKYVEEEKKKQTYEMGLNEYSLLTWEEFKSMHLNDMPFEKYVEENESEYVGDHTTNWVGSLDFSPVRTNTNNCANPHYAFAVANMIEGFVS